MADDHLLLPKLKGPSKILTPMITPEAVAKAQGRQMLLTPAQQKELQKIMKVAPGGGVTLHFDPKTGECVHMEAAR